MRPTPGLLEWMARHSSAVPGQRALVVGPRSAADAETVASLGFQATKLEPGAPLPKGTRRSFALVVIAGALELAPQGSRDAAALALADGVAGGGTLLVLARARDEGAREGGREPRALAASDLEPLERAGLDLVRFEDYEPEGTTERRFRAEYRRPPSMSS